MTCMAVRRAILSNSRPVFFYSMQNNFLVPSLGKLMCLFPSIQNPSYAANPSAPLPGKARSGSSKSVFFLVKSLKTQVCSCLTWGQFEKVYCGNLSPLYLIACMPNIKSTVRFLINSKNVSAVSRGPDFLLLTWHSPAIILWFLSL